MHAAAPTLGCSLKPNVATKQKTVSVNGIVISRAAISREAQHHPAAKPIEAWLTAARALVVREVLLQEAGRLGLVPRPLQDEAGRREIEEEALIRALVEQEVVTPVPDGEACRRYYDQNRSRFRSPDLYEVRHILIAVEPGGEAESTAARQLAANIASELAADPNAFDRLAAAHSACPSGKAGGHLGQIGLGQTVPEFERALPSLPVGSVAATPIETRYGLHVVAVDRHIAGRPLPYEAVQQRIAEYLRDHVRRTAIRQYISVLMGRADIRGIELGTNGSVLVQ
jgi:peptidyl-prolyl cis-trans isomerase C